MLPPEGAEEVAASLSEFEAWLAARVGQRPHPTKPNNVTPLAVLDAPDLVPPGEYLFLAGKASTGDDCLTTRLCYCSHGAFVLVDEPAKVAGRVTIRNPQAALRYARLFTCPCTVRCLKQPWWYELVPQRAVDTRFLFGLPESDDVDATRSPGWLGVLTEAQWARSGLQSARARREGKGFLVMRPLIRLSLDRPETRTAYEVQEIVSPDGDIRRSVSRAIVLAGLEFQLRLDK